MGHGSRVTNMVSGSGFRGSGYGVDFRVWDTRVFDFADSVDPEPKTLNPNLSTAPKPLNP